MNPNNLLMGIVTAALRTILLWPALLISCFRPYVGGWYVGFFLPILAPLAVFLMQGCAGYLGWHTDKETTAIFGSVLGFAALIGFAFNRWRHFRRLDKFATHSKLPGVWWFDLAPTLLWWTLILPLPILTAGFLAGQQGWGMAGAFLLWLGVAVGLEGALYMFQTTKTLVMHMDAAAMNGGMVHDKKQLETWQSWWQWIVFQPLRDPETGCPSTATGPGQVVFFSPDL